MRNLRFWGCLLLIFSLGFSEHVFGQDLDTYLAAARRHSRYPDSLKYYGRAMLDLPEVKAQFEGHFAIGYGFYRQHELDSAVHHYQISLRFGDTTANYSAYLRVVRNMGIAQHHLGDDHTAIAYFDTIMQLAEPRQDSMSMAYAKLQKGISFRYLGLLEEAIKYQSAAYSYLSSKGHPSAVNAATNIGVIYADMDLDSASLRWFRKAYRQAMESDNLDLRLRGINNMAARYRTLGQLDSSNHYLAELAQYQNEMSAIQKTLLYQNKASNAIDQARYTEADSLLKIAFKSLGSKPVGPRYIELLYKRSQLYYQRELYDSARRDLELGITQCDTTNNLPQLAKFQYLLSSTEEAAGRPEPALKALRAYQAIEAQLVKENKTAQMHEAVSAAEVKEKEAELARTVAWGKNWQQQLIWSLVALSIAILALIYTYRRYRRRRDEGRLAEYEVKKLQEELAELQAETGQHETFVLKSKAVIHLDQLTYVKSDGHYLNFYLNDQSQPEVERSTLKAVADQLGKSGVVQSHRSYLVNVRAIKAVYSNRLLLQDGTELPLSRKFKEQLESLLQANQQR